MKNLILLNRLGFNPDLTTRQSRVDSVSIASRYRVLATLLLCLTLFVGSGNAWGATATATSSTSTLVASTSYYDLETGKLIEVKNSAANSYSNPLRIYANNTFTFHCKSGATKITKIEVTANSTSYATTTSSATWAASGTGSCSATSSASGSKVTVTITGTATTVTCKPTSQIRWDLVVVTYETAATSHTLSSAVSPAESGSVSLGVTSVAEGSTTTATAIPYKGYVFSSWSISGTGASLSSTTDNPTTVTMGTANATVTATFAAAPKASVTLSEAGATTTDASTYYVGDSYTLPSTTEASCGGKVLVGWSTIEVAEIDTKPTSNYYEKGENVTLGATQTFYAVFATSTGSGTKWVLTDLGDADAGTYALLTKDFYAFNGSISNQDHGEVTVSAFSFTNGEAASAPSGTCEIEFVEVTGGFKMYNSATSKYLYAKSNASGNLAWSASESSYWSCGGTGNWTYEKNSAFLRSFSNNSIRTYGNNSGDLLKLAKKVAASSYTGYTTSCVACENIMALTAGATDATTHCTSVTFSNDNLPTCSDEHTDRQVTITVTPYDGYDAPAELTPSGAGTATHVNGPTGSGPYTYVYEFDRDDDGDGTFTATCTPKAISLVLDRNNSDVSGSADGSATVYFDATSLSTISHATRSGHVLDGYYAEPECTNKVLTDAGALVNYTGYVVSDKWARATTPTTLYAKWIAKSFDDYVFSCAELTLTAVPGNEVILITSTAGQWVRSHDSIHVVGSGLTPRTDITFTTGDADKFVVKDYKYNNISTNESGVVDTYVYVFYKPASDATTDGIESFSTLGASVGGAKPRSYSLTSHTFVGRHIPTNVVIAAKMGKGWYALPANMETTGVFAPELIAVDNTTNPTIAYSANSNVYNLYGNGYTTLNTSGTDGYLKKGNSGDQVKFGMPNNATTANAALWANNTAAGGTETHIGKNDDTDARNQIGANYWWNVALKSGISSISSVADIVYNVKNNQKGRTLKLLASAEGGPKWGLYAAGTGVEDIRLLSVEEINPLNLTVMEWGTNEIAVKYSGDGTTVTNAEVAGTKVTATLSNIGGDIQRISGLTDLNLHPGEELLIEITEDETPKQIILTIPYIVTSSTTVIALRNQTGESSQEAKNAVTRTIDLIIRGGGGHVNATSEEGNANPGAFKDIYIYPGGKLELSANNLAAKNVFLRGGFSWLSGKGGESSYLHPQLLVASDKSITGINATGCGVFYDLYLTGDQWYLMALPKDVALSAVRDEAGNTPVTSGGSQNIWIATYSGQGRTQSPRQPGWTDIEGDALSTFTFERGKGYEIAADPVNGERPLSILRFPLQVASAWSNDANEDVIVNSWGILRYNAGTLTANHVGWNFVGNPFYSAYQTSGTGIVAWGLKEHLDPVTEKWTGAYDWDEENMDNLKYYTIPNKTDYGYDDSRAASTKLDAFFPFYVQVKLANENNAVLSFSASTDRTLKAPAVKESEAKAREVIVDFVITNNENRPCLSGLNISDRYSAEFDMDDKEISISNGVNELKVYTLVGDMRTAFNSLPESAISTIPLGYKTTTNGIHTIALSESCNLKALKSAVLIDHEENNLEWDLLQGGYDFETAAQANGNDTRFTMKIELMPEEVVVTTDINEGGVFEKMFAIGYETKVVLHGVPIGADVWAYSMSGKLIGSWQEVKSNLWTIDVPAKGVYNIRVSVKGEAQTLRAVVQ